MISGLMRLLRIEKRQDRLTEALIGTQEKRPNSLSPEGTPVESAAYHKVLQHYDLRRGC